MIALSHFNQLAHADAVRLLEPCVAIASWREALVQARPWPTLPALMAAAQQIALQWGEVELDLALSAHPRIGEKPVGKEGHAVLSSQEQAAVNHQDNQLVQKLKEGNARYEIRFGRVFLIRAKGRSGEAVLRALTRRLQYSDAEETAEALAQLREITLLRLEGIIGE